MNVLAVETGTSLPSVALLKDGTPLVSAGCQPGQFLTSQLLPTIDRLLSSVGVPVTDLHGLAVAIGPGSFTGLRIGLATMTALRVARQIPLVGVSTLEGLAWNVGPTRLPILSAVAIKPGSVYWGLYQWEGVTLLRMREEAMGTVDEALQSVMGFREILVVGDGWSQNQQGFSRNGGPMIRPVSVEGGPSAQGIGMAGLALLARGQLLPEGSSPHYLQLSYAETAQGQVKASDG